MSNIVYLPARLHSVALRRSTQATEKGAATAEYGVTVLVGVAMALCVFNIITSGKLNGPIESLLHGVLTQATAMTR